MIFSELYSVYYNTIAVILKAAVEKPLKKNELRELIERNAFGESILNIEPAITEERWQLIREDGSTPLKHTPSLPLTTIEKRWLKAIYADRRIRLFTDEVPDFSDVEPFFGPDDVSVYDKYQDGDPYEDEAYIKNFRLILDAVKNRYPLSIHSESRKGNVVHKVLMPEYLEYSEKDDKFRLIGSGCRYGGVVNVARIVSCRRYTKPYEIITEVPRPELNTVVFELTDKRNALERVLLHFAHFEKTVEKISDNSYLVTVSYDNDDETEMVIRILSFGPMLKVTSPQSFVELIKERLLNQKSCGL